MEPLASTLTQPKTTYAPPSPTRTRVGNYDVFDGVSEVSDLVLDIDGPQAKAALKGRLTIRPVSGSAVPLQVPLYVKGDIRPEDYSAYMWPTNPVELEALKMKVGVKLMCLTTDCAESFLDIYVQYKGRIYHHQVKSEMTKTSKPTTSSSHKTERPEKLASDSSTETLPEQDSQDRTDGVELEHDESGLDEEMGTFVGEPEKDVNVFFPPTKPATPVKPVPPQEEKKPQQPSEKPQKPEQEAENKRPEAGKPAPVPQKPPRPQETQTPPPVVSSPSLPSWGKTVLDRISQAIGSNSKGRLENAENIYKYQKESEAPGFNFIYPQRETYYGTTDMLNIMARIGKFSLQQVNGYVISVGDVSRKTGGKLGGHASHQRGLDADISYYFDNPSLQKGFVNVLSTTTSKRSWMADKQWQLFKALVSTQVVDRIFMDTKLKRDLCEIATRNSELKRGQNEGLPFETLRVISHEAGHANHFHLRLKCSKMQPRCQQMAPPQKVSGC